MPTPIEIIVDPISLGIFMMYLVLIVWEFMYPATTLSASKHWKSRGLISFICFFFLSSYLPLLWEDSLSQYQVLNLEEYNILYSTLIGLFVYELAVYVWHRCLHQSSILWRWFHQMHHSAERMDSYGAFWFSPMDMVGWTFLSSFCLTLIVGLPTQAVSNIILLTTFFAIFQHSNIRTPQLLGYFIQRPESHSVHHATHTHYSNFSDLPIFDLIFGTFCNPKQATKQTGFYPGASLQVWQMMRGKDLQSAQQTPANNSTYIQQGS
ncbi:MAG: sterol desaturase family protein [Gammaproteobacteria bacterium]|nr:sterol desaturase family protein [Gammaproteobacteria bacterium]MDH5731354.1 sterol desaturase family protein [Gammaproteobacteria bacterium]